MWAALAAVAALTGASAGALALVRNQGVHINGDEPSYLVEAESIARYFTLNSNPGYNFIITHHIVYPFTQKPGPNVAAQMTWEAILRHHLYLPTHSVGLSVLLAVPILFGPTVAIVAFLAMLAALAVGVVHLVGLLAGTRSPWRFALAGVFLVPSYLVASTQVYPDLMTGMIIAVVVLLVALFETKRGCTTAQVVTGGLLLALFPWLAQKNIPLTCLLLVVLVVASRRTLMAGAQLAWLAVPALVSLSGVVLFNLWAYGHPLGSKNPVTTSGIETWTRSAALVFDRRSGILIQMPILVLGVAALWVWRRRIPLAVIAAVVLTAAIVYGNGTEPGSQTGGSFNGRYEWPLVPLALAFCALYVIDLWRVRRATVPLIVGIAAVLSVFEAVPIILGEHLYYSQIPWDPISYRGWWGGLDPSPVLGYLPAAQIFNLPILTPGGGSGIPAFLPGTIPWGNARDLWGLACVAPADGGGVVLPGPVGTPAGPYPAPAPGRPRCCRVGLPGALPHVPGPAPGHGDLLGRLPPVPGGNRGGIRRGGPGCGPGRLGGARSLLGGPARALRGHHPLRHAGRRARGGARRGDQLQEDRPRPRGHQHPAEQPAGGHGDGQPSPVRGDRDRGGGGPGPVQRDRNDQGREHLAGQAGVGLIVDRPCPHRLPRSTLPSSGSENHRRLRPFRHWPWCGLARSFRFGHDALVEFDTAGKATVDDPAVGCACHRVLARIGMVGS